MQVIADNIQISLNDFLSDCYGTVPLGELLWDASRVPLTNAIRREIFIGCFKELFEAFSFCGTFESYITVFKKIFGDDVEIEFTVPGPGKLNIDITTSGIQEFNFIAREILSNAYVRHTIVDHNGDKILLRGILGIETPYELEKALFTMVPGGIYTQVSLTIG